MIRYPALQEYGCHRSAGIDYSAEASGNSAVANTGMASVIHHTAIQTAIAAVALPAGPRAAVSSAS